MKVCFETFGCRLNKAEALQMEAEYFAKGWERTEKHSDADLFVVRGCSVTKRAQRDCEKLIENFAENVILEKESNRLVNLRYGVFLNAQTEPEVSERFARAKAAAYSVSAEGQICGFHEGNA